MQDWGASFGTSIEGWREVSRRPGLGGDRDRQRGLEGGVYSPESIRIYILYDPYKLYH